MRKFVTVLMMMILLAMPHNLAWAVKSGSGSGSSSGEGKGGYDANVTLEQALARPAFFVTIALTQILIFATLFTPRFLVGRMDQRTFLTLATTSTLTAAYFFTAISEYFRYLIYLMIGKSYFTQYLTAPRTSSQVPVLDDDVYSVAVPEVSTVIRKTDDTPLPPARTEKQKAIDAAVDRALRDPELAEKYLEFASPDVRKAVNNALNNQFETENRNRYSIEDNGKGVLDAIREQSRGRK